MRRGVGVGHIHAKKIQAEKMSSLGAELTAERVGQLSNQLDLLTQQLQAIASEHDVDIKSDPVARAKLLHLADALQVDLLATTDGDGTSKPKSGRGSNNKLAELSSFYSQLASRVIGVCKVESIYTGALVPLSHVLKGLKKQDRFRPNAAEISADDVKIALSEVAQMCATAAATPLSSSSSSQSVFGRRKQPTAPLSSVSGAFSSSDVSTAPLYSVVSIGGDEHVKVAPVIADASSASVDAVELQKAVAVEYSRRCSQQQQRSNNHHSSNTRPHKYPHPHPSHSQHHRLTTTSAQTSHHTSTMAMYAAPGTASKVGRLAAPVSAAPPPLPREDEDQPVGLDTQMLPPSFTLTDIVKLAPVNWSRVRTLVALQQLLTNGIVWMDVPPPPTQSTSQQQEKTPQGAVGGDCGEDDYIFISAGSGSTTAAASILAHSSSPAENDLPPGPLAVLHTTGATFWFMELIAESL